MKFRSVVLSFVLAVAGVGLGAGTAQAAAGTCTGAYTSYNGNRSAFTRYPAIGGNDTVCVLRSGNENAAVSALQRSIRSCYGINLAVDGDFGAATRSAVRTVQAREGVTQDGVYGPQTREAMLWAFFRVRDGSFFDCGGYQGPIVE